MRSKVLLVLLATVASVAACVPHELTPLEPLASSSLEAARNAQAGHWQVRVITFERDTAEGYARVAEDRIRVGARTFAPGEVLAMQRRVGSSHIAEKTLLGIALTSAASMVFGELWRRSSGPDQRVPPTAEWALGGASAGLAIGVFSQYGVEESRWVDCWRQ